MLVVSLGLDTLRGDPDASDNAGFRLETCDFALMGRMLRSMGLPVLLLQEGGYQLDKVGDAVLQLFHGIQEL